MNQFLKPTRTKLKIMLYFFALSFLFSTLFSIFNRMLIANTLSEEELYFLIQYILPIPCFVLVALKFYLFACLAIYLVSKAEKNKKKD